MMRRCGVLLFAVLPQVSRCSVLEYGSSNGDGRRVTVIPMLHVGTKKFYDTALQWISRSRMATPKVTKILVEGVCETTEDRVMQQSEWARIHEDKEESEVIARAAAAHAADPNATSAAASCSSSTQQELVRQLCMEYKLRFPLPTGLILEDLYFKRLLACAHGDILVNCDVDVADVAHCGVSLLSPVVSSIREERCMQHIVGAIRGDKRSQHITAHASLHVAVVWGHFHCGRFVDVLTKKYGFVEVQHEECEYGCSIEACLP